MVPETSLRQFRPFFLLVVLLLLCTVASSAQYSGNIQGVVSDPAGAAITGASVQLLDVDTGVSSTTKTSDTGNYRFSSLPPGNYVVTAEAAGFRKTESKFTLSTSETKGLNLALSIGSAQQTIVVEVAPPAVDTDDSRLQATLSADTVRDLPSANRNLWDVLAVAPGVVGNGTRGAGESPGGFADNFGTQTPQISANGRSYTGNMVMVDGMNVTSPIQNGNIILAPIPEAVQEATLQTNSWDGNINLGSSILVQVTTKSGTNKFHGSGSVFFTNQDLVATPYFTAPGSYLPYGRKDLVGTLGGPIQKDKTFFFADFEKLWAKTAGAVGGTQFFEDPAFVSWAQTNYPNAVGTQVLTDWPASRLKGSVYQTALQYLGAGNCGIAGTPDCSMPMVDSGSFAASPYYNALQYNFRLDHYFTQNDRLYLSYYNNSFDQQQLSPRPRLDALDIMRNRYGQIDFTHTFSSQMLIEGGFAFASVGGANGQDAKLAVPNISVTNGNLVGTTVGGGWGPGEYRGPNYNWRGVLSWVRGKHTLRFGYDGDHAIEHGDFTPANVRPSFGFNDLLTLVQDNPHTETVAAYDPLTGGPGSVAFGGQTNPFGFFVQDDWKVKPNLALTLSLRWDDFGNHAPWGNSGFKFGALILAPGGNFNTQVANASVGTVPTVFANDMKNLFSPRIGFSWDPTKNGKWAVRGGVGVFHDWVVLGQSVDQTRNNPPGVLFEPFTDTAPNGTPLGNYFTIAPSQTYPWGFILPEIPAGSLNDHGGIAGLPTGVNSLSRSMVAPLAVNYLIGVEHQLMGGLVAGANYSGSKSYNALTGSNVNYFPGGAMLSKDTTTNVVGESIGTLNENFGPITYVTNANQASYNAMILFIRGRAGHRGSFQGSYTLSHAKNYPEANTRFDQDGGLNIPQSSSYFSYYGDANYDVRQRFSFSGSYTLPGVGNGFAKVLTGGWELSSIVAIQTGTPFWVIDNRSLSVMCSDDGTLNGTNLGPCPSTPTTLDIVTGVSPTATNPNGYVLAPNSGDYNLDGTSYDVPMAPSQNFTGSHSRSAYINGLFKASDFPQAAVGTEGNLRRNIYRNPGLVQVDASLLKNNRLPWIGEQGNLQFRFDFINLFNHTNLGPVDAN
ncbi:MAG TPA: TonB-dependent receptor, partial [Candidatus Sulfotelmatobacter sp.]|nr:TonB-dependent receptor [Candidatus Sulfotelmatobacter sp.]